MLGVRCEDELGVLVVGVLSQRLDSSCAGLDRDDGGVGSVGAPDRSSGLNDGVGGTLTLEVQGGGDLQATARQELTAGGDIGSEVLRAEDLIDHIGAEVGVAARSPTARGRVLNIELDLGVDGLVVLLLGNELLFQHLGQHPVPTVLGQFRLGLGVVGAGCVGGSGQQGGLGHRQILGVLIEVVQRGGLHPVGGGTEGGDVEVALEDLLLGVLLLQAEGELHLPQLAGHGALGGVPDELVVVVLQAGLDEGVAHVLLGQRGGALTRAAGVVGHQGPHHAGGVDALVLVEALVLDGDDRVLHVDRDRAQGHHDAVLRVELGDLGAVGGQEGGDLAGRLNVEVAGELLEELGGCLGQRCRGAHEGSGEARGQDPADARESQEDHEHRDDLGWCQGAPARRGFRHGVSLRGIAWRMQWRRPSSGWEDPWRQAWHRLSGGAAGWFDGAAGARRRGGSVT